MKMYLRPNGLLKHRTSKTAALHRALRKSVKRGNKYGARKTVIHGIEFASKAEAMHFLVLKDRQRKGEITTLEMQPGFDLIVNGHKVGTYTADFGYTENGKPIIEETKGFKARDFALRSKLFMALYPNIELRINGVAAKRPKSLPHTDAQGTPSPIHPVRR